MTPFSTDTDTPHRPALFSAAYHLLGDVAEAEDVVQDCYLTWFSEPRENVIHPQAYLLRMVVNRATDRLRQRQRERAAYVGTWLPVPITDETDCGLTEAEKDQLLPYAMLTLLEKLTPTERAVFVLRKAFSYSYADIADLCHLTEANCRQLLHRAAEKVRQPNGVHRKKNDPTLRQDTGRLLTAFLRACQSEDADELARLLHTDVMMMNDGGGKMKAALKPLTGVAVVSRFILNIMRHFGGTVDVRLTRVNGGPGFVVFEKETGRIDTIFTLTTDGDHITQLFGVRNPDKISG